MLESVVASLLGKYLGKYVEGLQTENLQLSLGSGSVVLENLALRVLFFFLFFFFVFSFCFVFFFICSFFKNPKEEIRRKINSLNSSEFGRLILKLKNKIKKRKRKKKRKEKKIK